MSAIKRNENPEPATERALFLEKAKMKLLDRKALCDKVPYSDRYILKLESIGQFPKRIVLSPRRVAWDEAEVDAWIEERRQANIKASAPLEAIDKPVQ